MPRARVRARSKFLPTVCPATVQVGVRWSLGAAYCTGGSSARQAVTVSRYEAIRERAEGAEWFGGDEVPQEAPSEGRLASQDCGEGEVARKLSSWSHVPGRVVNIVLSERVVVEIDPLPGCTRRKIGEYDTKSFDPETAKCAVSIENKHPMWRGWRCACSSHRSMLTHDLAVVRLVPTSN